MEQFYDQLPGQWRAQVEKVLKGAPFTRLISRNLDGINYGPLHLAASSTQTPIGRLDGRAWQIAQRIDHPDVVQANALALQDLQQGVDSFVLVFEGAVGAYGFGLTCSSDALKQALRGIEIERRSWRLDGPGDGVAAAEAFWHFAREAGLPAGALKVDLACSPVNGWLANQPFEEIRLLALTDELRSKGFCGTVFVADGRPFHNAGASEAQELASVLASGADLFRRLYARGWNLERIRSSLSFILCADADQFLTLAKFRALRLLWARLEESCSLPPRPACLWGESAWRMMTRTDPYVNVLRATMAGFSAALGGADSVCLLPFTQALGLPDAAARRLACTSQTIMLEEAHLAVVSDPGAGAGALEHLTEQLCVTAWELFQCIEARGGLLASLEDGFWPSAIADVAAKRDKALRYRKDVLTGTSAFALPNEPIMPVLLPMPQTSAPQLRLPIHRLSEPFEALHRRAQALGANANVFLANLGTGAGFIARATFATSFLSAGGLNALGNDGFAQANGQTDLAALTTAALASRARVICLCGSDAIYQQEAVNAAMALQKTNALLILAGKPGEWAVQAGQAGLRLFIFAGCDALNELEQMLSFIERQHERDDVKCFHLTSESLS